MRLRQRLISLLSGNGKVEQKLQDPAKTAVAKVDPIERIAKLKDAGLDLTVELYRATGGGRGAARTIKT